MPLKALIRYPFDIRRARRLLAEKQLTLEAPQLTAQPIVLDLRTPQLLFDCGRHLASLAHYANDAGSPFYIRCNQRLLASFARKIHGREMLADSHAQWIPSSARLPDSALVLTDEPQQPGIQMLIGRDIDRRLPVMPYPMHPATLPHADRQTLVRLRQTPRAGIFFAGNQKPKYGDSKIKRHFGVLSRLEILSQLTGPFSDRIVDSVSEDSHRERIVICDSRVHSIAASDWLPTLSRFRFFLCCPGSAQPTCHNLIESMSVGTIPIIEYGDRVTPELRDGENAICFRGRDGLVDAIRRIDGLSNQSLRVLSQNVASFYDQHLCGTRFMVGLRDGQHGVSAGKICMPFHERNFYESSTDIDDTMTPPVCNVA